MVAGRVSQTDMDKYNDEAFKNYNDKALDPCPNCGRTFLPDRLTIHLKSCNKAHGKPADAGASSLSPMKGSSMGGSSSAGAFGSPSKSPVI